MQRPGLADTAGHLRPELQGPISADQIESIVRVAESAMDVRRRYQFFVWTRSNLQALLPHQLAVCGAYARANRDLLFEAFNSVALPGDLLEALVDARAALMQQLQGRWIDQRCKAMIIPVDSLLGDVVAPIRAYLQAAGYKELLVHGVSRPQRPSELESFFIFADSNASFVPQQRMLLDLLMPHLHATWLRVQATEREVSESPMRMQSSSKLVHGVTEREREILTWVREGKSNQQIGEQLGISALTVKNHVQKILRKLGAANRAQAVARAMTMNLLGRGSMQGGDAGA